MIRSIIIIIVFMVISTLWIWKLKSDEKQEQAMQEMETIDNCKHKQSFCCKFQLKVGYF